MNKIFPLMQREWLQHRTGWALMTLIPLGLALLAVTFGQVQIEGSELAAAGDALPAVMAMAAIGGTTAVLFIITLCSSLILVSGLARRDHADRSVEFWLSQPVSHSASLGTPLLVHLVLVPAAGLLVGMLGGYVLSLFLVGRMVGLSQWLSLPWGTIIPASFSIALRLMAGLPLAVMWASPLILLVVLLTAWFRRWGWVIMGVGLGLGSLLMKKLFGQPWINEVMAELLRNAAAALISPRDGGLHGDGPRQAVEMLGRVPSWAATNFGHTLQDLANPLLPGALLFSAGCFWLLVQWRRNGAGGSSS